MARIPYPDRDSIPAEMMHSSARYRGTARWTCSATPTLGRLFLLQGQALITSIELSPRCREIVILTVATLTECAYEFTQHVPISAAAGITDAERDAIRRGAFADEV